MFKNCISCICSCISSEYKEREILGKCTNENTPSLNFDGKKHFGKVVDIYDADTITVALYFHGVAYKIKCRLARIDSAEIRTKNKEEKIHAIAGKKYLSDLILDRIIYIHCGKWDKYGRLLVDLYFIKDGDQCINDMIVEENYAYYYDGKKKRKFVEWYKNEKKL